MKLDFIRWSLLTIVISTGQILYAQGPAHADYKWYTNESCIWDVEMFRTQEVAPQILSLSRSEFDDIINLLSDQLELTQNAKGAIKVRLFFIVDRQICIWRIGDAHINLSDQQVQMIFDFFNLDLEFSPGSQGGSIVGCEGLLTLTISNGAVSCYETTNFDLAH